MHVPFRSARRKRTARTGLVAGMLALAVFGAACGGGGSGESVLEKQAGVEAPEAEAEQPVEEAPAEAPVPAPVVDTTPAPVATTAIPAPVTTAPRPAAPKPAAPKPAPAPAPKPAPAPATTAPKPQEATLRLGYFPNVTHAAAIAGVEKDFFGKHLGSHVNLKTASFNAGPAVIEALFADQIDASYIGPNPAINGFVKSNGEALRIVAGATSGGASLVVKPNITTVQDLVGQKIATPQLGNTQDVALRAWLLEKGYKTDPQGGGDMKVVPQENAQTLEQFKSGQISAAWVPEPWATRLVQQAGGKVFLDERSLWPDGKFVTTHIIVRTKFLNERPDVIKNLIAGHIEATDWLNANLAEAQSVVNGGIAKLTGQAMPVGIIAAAWEKLNFVVDPIASSLRKSATDAQSAGLLDSKAKIDGIYDLRLINEVLTAAGKPTVNE